MKTIRTTIQRILSHKAVKVAVAGVEWVMFGLIMLLCLAVLSPMLPTSQYFSTYIVPTGSMEPVIKAGSVVLSSPIDAAAVQVGQILAFRSPTDPNQTILHRVSEIKMDEGGNQMFLTKGDNNDSTDGWVVDASMIYGELRLAIPYLGLPAAMLREPAGFAIVMGIPALILIVLNLIKIKQGIEEEVERKTKKALEKHAATTSKKSTMLPMLMVALSTIMLSAAGSLSASVALAQFQDTLTISGLTISTKDFVAPPAPQLVSPAHGITRTTDGLVMDWSDVSDYENTNNPVYYLYQSSRYSDFSIIAYNSMELSASFIPQPNTPDGTYYWHVKACDAIHNCSDWSEVWSVTIDADYTEPIVVSPSPTPTSTPIASPIPSVSPSPSPTPTSSPVPTGAGVVINEVYYDVADDKGAAQHEWIELYNNTDAAISVKDWTLTDFGNDTRSIAGNAVIPAHGFLLLAYNASTWSPWTLPSGVDTVNLTGSSSWLNNDGGESLTLKNAQGVVVDGVSWEGKNGWSISAPKGKSIARNPKGHDTDTVADWVVVDHPNPGTNPHSHFQPVVEQSGNDLKITIDNAIGLDSLQYSVSYTRQQDGVSIDEVITGESAKQPDEAQMVLPTLYLGTCSTLKTQCVPHLQITGVRIQLLYKLSGEVLGTSTVAFDWK